MELSDTARMVLQAHANEPARPFYGIDLLGSFYRDTDLRRLDAAYDELRQAGLLSKAGGIISYFGEPKSLYRITDEGIKEAAREKVA
ncbi:MAG TPA: hypothetical protein VGI81_13640 [Tepidisphaeraceae bacterium]